MVKRYLDLVNTQNSVTKCDAEHCIYKQQLYQEVLEKIAAEMSTYFWQFVDTMKDTSSNENRLTYYPR